jgi:hypothetical protein
VSLTEDTACILRILFTGHKEFQESFFDAHAPFDFGSQQGIEVVAIKFFSGYSLNASPCVHTGIGIFTYLCFGLGTFEEVPCAVLQNPSVGLEGEAGLDEASLG